MDEVARARKHKTQAAARFLAEQGEQLSYRTLQAYRLKGADDPGEKGPRWYRDPQTNECWYFEADLLEWTRTRNERLVERQRARQPTALARAAA